MTEQIPNPKSQIPIPIKDNHSRDGEKGVILLLTLFVIAIFTILVLEFSYTTRVEYHIARSIRDELLASAIARGGIYETIASLREHRLEEIEEKEAEEKAKGRSEEEMEEARKKRKRPEPGQLEEISFPDHYGEAWAEPRYMEPYGEGYLNLKVIDESGKIGINTLVKEIKEVTAVRKVEEPAPEDEGEETIIEEPKPPPRRWGQTDEEETGEEVAEEKDGEETTMAPPVRYVVDKRVEKDIMRLIETLDVRSVDEDSDNEGDWEEDAYARSEGSTPHNAPLDVLSELLMVEGVIPDLYFGPGRPETVDLEKEMLKKGGRTRGTVGLRDCLTVCSRTKVNVNTAPPEVLTALLEEENESLVKEITNYTRRDYFEDLADFSEEIGEHIPASFRARIGVGSDSFQIIAEGIVNESKKQIQAFIYMDEDGNVKILYWREAQ
ncbi:MAG: type II secretion system protein GspK [bacterium]